MDEHPDLVFETIRPASDPASGDDARAARVRGFDEAFHRAFLEGRTTDEGHRRWLEHVRADDVTLRGAWEVEPVLGAGTIPVATFSSFGGALNVGGGRTAPLHMITDVTVSPTRRRRG